MTISTSHKSLSSLSGHQSVCFTFGENNMSDLAHVAKICHQLTDAWCDRREKKCLVYLLGASLSPLAHTDQLGDLLSALKDVKGLCHDELTREEINLVNDAHNTLDDILNGPLETR
jgi:hypothetical protein